ncbi:MAG: DinB family protein [Chloroflexi bacterium]|nr:DinB family protein [Chloroflexota bacterium]
MKKQVSTEQTDANIKEVIRLLAETPEKLERLSRGLSEEQLHRPLGAGERSFTEVLAHLLHCEAIITESIQLALLKDEPLLAGIHAERDLGKLLRLDLLPFPELSNYFILRRKILLCVLNSLDDKQWSRCVREEEKRRKESVYWRARGQALHELEHLLDLANKLQKSYK